MGDQSLYSSVLQLVTCICTIHILLQAETKRRQGVSQYKQPHVMLHKGLDLLEETFPGYQSELAKAGALDVDLLEDLIMVFA